MQVEITPPSGSLTSRLKSSLAYPGPRCGSYSAPVRSRQPAWDELFASIAVPWMGTWTGLRKVHREARRSKES